MRIVVAASIGRFPVGGHAWIDMQYLLALRALGHEVYYLEDCGDESWVYDWGAGQLTTDLVYPTRYIQACLSPAGLDGSWIYRAGDAVVGMPLSDFLDVCHSADLLLIRGASIPKWREEYFGPRRRAFLDVDPVFTQIKIANGTTSLAETVRHCERLFTISQRIGATDCSVPTAGLRWIPTVSPIHLPAWPVAEDDRASRFTTIMQWRSYNDVHFNGIDYGNKDREFPRFLSLPQHTSQVMQLALTGGDPDYFRAHDWEVVEGWSTSLTPDAYQQYVQSSRAEFSVAKHGYVCSQGGWFSDRSVCYLASGRPVLVQDTGLRDWLPSDEGVLVFSDMTEALEGIRSINADYSRHRIAARRIAEEYFAADRVLSALLVAAMS